MTLADVDLTPWASGATIAGVVFSILAGVTVGLWALNGALGRRFDKHSAAVTERFDHQDDETATFRSSIQTIVDELRATDRDHDTRITRVETRLDEHDKIHSRQPPTHH